MYSSSSKDKNFKQGEEEEEEEEEKEEEEEEEEKQRFVVSFLSPPQLLTRGMASPIASHPMMRALMYKAVSRVLLLLLLLLLPPPPQSPSRSMTRGPQTP
jgi:cation transport ATPase